MRSIVTPPDAGGSTGAVTLESRHMVTAQSAFPLIDHGPLAWLGGLMRLVLVLLAHAVLLGYIAFQMADTTPSEPPKTIEVSLIAPPAPEPVAPPPVVTPPEPPKPEPPPPKPEVKKPEPPKPVVKPEPKPKPKPRPKPKQAISEPKPAPEPEPAPEPVAQAPAEPSPPPVANPPPAPVKAPAASRAAAPVTQASFNAAYLNNPRPAYPRLSRRLNEQGKVLLRVRVNADGVPEQVNLHETSGHKRLDDAARRAVAQWRFVPAKQGETAIASWVIVPIEFKLEDR